MSEQPDTERSDSEHIRVSRAALEEIAGSLGGETDAGTLLRAILDHGGDAPGWTPRPPEEYERWRARREREPVAVEFAPELIEPRSWRIKGVGAYGSDVDVVSFDQYQELSHLYRTNMAILQAWAHAALTRKDMLRRALEQHDRGGAAVDSPLANDLWREIRTEVERP